MWRFKSNSPLSSRMSRLAANPPGLVSCTIASNGTTVTMVFTTPVTSTGVGWGLRSNAHTLALSSGSGSNTLVFTSGTTVLAAETGVTVSYAYGFDTKSIGGMSMQAVNLVKCTNNSVQ